jgi:methionine synthase II (cobalamin-independent)
MSMINAKTTPHRFDTVGSFLRPESLKKARADFETGAITAEQLKAVEDEAIRDLVAKQKKAGLRVITDGEFRRATWHLDFMWGFDGVGHSPTKFGLPFHGEAAMIDDTYLTGKVSVGHHPFVDHFRFVKELEDENTVAKLTIPAPAQFLEQMILPSAMENTGRYYADTDELAQDIANSYKKVIRELYDAGCRNLQLDDCSWGMCVDPHAARIFGTDEKGLQGVMEQLLQVNNLAIEGKPADMVINTHVCRGNFHSTWASNGAYDRVAETLFARENVNAFFLEYDDERSGGFAPLQYVSEDKKVVLGLITTKSPVLEDKETVIGRIHKAAKYVPLERLCLSPQCGFASCEIGNKLTEQEQWAKVALVKEIAEEVWG